MVGKRIITLNSRFDTDELIYSQVYESVQMYSNSWIIQSDIDYMKLNVLYFKTKTKIYKSKKANKTDALVLLPFSPFICLNNSHHKCQPYFDEALKILGEKN